MRQDNAAQRKSKNSGATGAKKQPRRITETYLHNAGLHYLQRFSASSAHFRIIMLRKVRKSCAAHTDQDFTKCERMVERLVEKFIASGLINDETHAGAMASSLRRRGKSRSAIMNKMREKGIEPELAHASLNELDSRTKTNSEDPELEAARIHARRKKLGPYRGIKQPDTNKELASLARAGFSYDIARKIISAPENDDDMAQQTDRPD